jgi:hypothetical protein
LVGFALDRIPAEGRHDRIDVADRERALVLRHDI